MKYHTFNFFTNEYFLIIYIYKIDMLGSKTNKKEALKDTDDDPDYMDVASLPEVQFAHLKDPGLMKKKSVINELADQHGRNSEVKRLSGTYGP